MLYCHDLSGHERLRARRGLKGRKWKDIPRLGAAESQGNWLVDAVLRSGYKWEVAAVVSNPKLLVAVVTLCHKSNGGRRVRVRDLRMAVSHEIRRLNCECESA